jgi:hypothetical protein
VTGSEHCVSDAYLDGWHAHRKFGPPTPDNPYNEDTQPRSHTQWLSGWCDRFNAVKRGYDLEHDETLF